MAVYKVFIANKIDLQLYAICFFMIFLSCKNEGVYKIGTYNVRYDNKTDDESGRSWKERSSHVTDLIKKYDLDIFGVQEPFYNQINDMASSLPEYKRFGVSDDNKPNSKSNHHHDIFYKSEKFSLESHGQFWLSPGAPILPPDSLYTAAWGGKAKVCTWGKFKDKAANAEFFIFNTHFYYANENTRINSAKLVLKKIKEIAGDLPAMFMGDLNLNQHSDAYKVLNDSNLLEDSYNLAESKLPLNKLNYHQTFNHWYLYPKPRADIFERIDYIFVTNHWKNKVKSNAVIWDSYVENDIEKMTSDHNLVLIELDEL
ncbi:MAG: endonuclease/exonuclease/phosphatase family protein [Flavobacteriaceae bacterium]|nr:endonuclease/exonuclease/phosphatase family protein [Flavobacteriaceae bacterium]